MLDMLVLIPPGANGLRASSLLAATGRPRVVRPRRGAVPARLGPVCCGGRRSADAPRSPGRGDEPLDTGGRRDTEVDDAPADRRCQPVGVLTTEVDEGRIGVRRQVPDDHL